MGVFRGWRRSRYMMYLILVKLFLCLGWLSSIAFGQYEVSETLSGSVNSFPDIGITCIGNLAVFFTSFLRGKVDWEISFKDVLATVTGSKLRNINMLDMNSFGMTTCGEGLLGQCSVVMLSQEMPNSSMKQFLRYIDNVSGVKSVVLQCLPLKKVAMNLEICTCHTDHNNATCSCIVFWSVETVTNMLVHRMPGTIKRLSDSLFLLPTANCLKNGCHGCKMGLLHLVYETEGFVLRNGNPMAECPAAVCITLPDVFDQSFRAGSATCICIPLLRAADDGWTKLLIRSFKSEDNEPSRAVISQAISSVSYALENYQLQSVTTGECFAEEEYSIASLIMPRLTEILINLVLTFWFKVDGFSSALAARRAIKQYILDNRGTGFAPHVFLAKAKVTANTNYDDQRDRTNVCQVLSFRGNLLSLKTLSCAVSFVNLICTISWAFLVALEGGSNKWYHTHSMPLSIPRITVILLAIGIAFSMDCADLYLHMQIGKLFRSKRKFCMVSVMMLFEILCIVLGSRVAVTWGIKGFGPWVYSVMQSFVWMKWALGSYLLVQTSGESGTSMAGGIMVECTCIPLHSYSMLFWQVSEPNGNTNSQ